jgi:hypothetical protein
MPLHRYRDRHRRSLRGRTTQTMPPPPGIRYPALNKYRSVRVADITSWTPSTRLGQQSVLIIRTERMRQVRPCLVVSSHQISQSVFVRLLVVLRTRLLSTRSSRHHPGWIPVGLITHHPRSRRSTIRTRSQLESSLPRITSKRYYEQPTAYYPMSEPAGRTSVGDVIGGLVAPLRAVYSVGNTAAPRMGSVRHHSSVAPTQAPTSVLRHISLRVSQMLLTVLSSVKTGSDRSSHHQHGLSVSRSLPRTRTRPATLCINQIVL